MSPPTLRVRCTWGIAAARSEDPARLPDHDEVWLAAAREGGALELANGRGPGHILQARVNADPAGGRFLVAVLDLLRLR